MNKQDELLSRREFFQKAVEKTLPIIGFLALGNFLQACGDNLQLSGSLANNGGGTGGTGNSGGSGNAKIPSDASGSIGGVEYVDLGLSVLWARCNIGASSPDEPCDEYSPFVPDDWNSRENYIRSLCLYYNTTMEINKKINVPGSKFDRVTEMLGKNWCSPTQEQVRELFDNCTIEFFNKDTGETADAEYGTREWNLKTVGYGYLLTSKINGNTLLFWNKYSGTGDYATSTIKSGGGLHSAYITYKPYVPYPRTDDELWNYDKYEVNFRPVVNSESNGSQGGGPGGNQGGGCTDCGSNCTGECKTGCSYNCAATCTNNCGGQCNTTCGGSCKYVNAGSSCSGCARTCDGRCYHTCDRACSNNCESTCVHQSR